MKNIALAADNAMEIPGVFGIAVLDERSGEVMLEMGGVEKLSRGIAAVACPSFPTREVEDILITLGNQYHIIRPIGAALGVSNLLLFVAMDRGGTNLAMARMKVAQIEKGISLSTDELDTLRSLRLKPKEPSFLY